MNTSYNISTEDFESIERYLLGEMSNEEKISFEKQMAGDELLSAKLKEVKLLLEGIEVAAMKEQLSSYKLSSEKHTEKKIAVVAAFNRRLLVAASVIVLAVVAVVLFVTRGNKYEKVYATYYKPDPGLITTMGITDNYAFNKAMVDYKTGNYKKAIDEWRKLKTGMPANDTLDYFLGAAEQANGNNDAALKLLKQIASDPSKPFYKDACWYTGLALINKGILQEAIPYLEKSGRKESTELINKLR